MVAVAMIPRRAFTFIEVLACLLVLGLGVSAAIGMVMYGVMIANRAQGQATALATGMSIAIDPSPLLPPGSSWDGTHGFINGFYVVRQELPDGTPAPSFRGGEVTVDVFDGFKGSKVAGYRTRVLRQELP
jgi:prepilin-type N-terminal cleavage/methylation domain-containing protein